MTGTDALTPRRRLRVIEAQRVHADRMYFQLYEAIVESEEDVDQRLTDLAWWIRVLIREEKLIRAELGGYEPPQLMLCQV